MCDPHHQGLAHITLLIMGGEWAGPRDPISGPDTCFHEPRFELLSRQNLRWTAHAFPEVMGMYLWTTAWSAMVREGEWLTCWGRGALPRMEGEGAYLKWTGPTWTQAYTIRLSLSIHHQQLGTWCHLPSRVVIATDHRRSLSSHLALALSLCHQSCVSPKWQQAAHPGTGCDPWSCQI